MISLPLIHFNDAYTLRHQDSDVSHFAGTVNQIRETWPKRGKRPDGLFLFSGDIFGPSVESTFTRGEHMTPVLNELGIDVACLGNHDFDFGLPQLEKLISRCNFPWLLSNIIDTNTEKPWAPSYWITEKCGVKIGVIALVEADWVPTVMNWDTRLQHRSMLECALKLSKELRDPQGPHCVELIIALTHSRLPNDIELAQLCNTRPSSNCPNLANSHGIDIILGGHDHFFYVSKGCQPFIDFENGPQHAAHNHGHTEKVYGSEADDGVLVIKSGTDFHDLSSIELVLEDSHPGSIRRKVIREVRGRRYWITGRSPSSDIVRKTTDEVLKNVDRMLHVPICYTLTPWDVRSEVVRTRETAFGNLVADALFGGYAELLEEWTQRNIGIRTSKAQLVDGVLICGGSLRTDTIYPPGQISAYDVVKILPFDDPIVVIDISGEALWDAIECSLSLYPALEGRFPVIAGMHISWDSTAPPMQRLRKVEFLNVLSHKMSEVHQIDKVEENIIDVSEGPSKENGYPTHKNSYSGVRYKALGVPNIRGSTNGKSLSLTVSRKGPQFREKLDRNKVYRIVTAEYMAEGYDGFVPLKQGNHIVGHENGLMMCEIVRRYLVSGNILSARDIQKLKTKSEPYKFRTDGPQELLEDELIIKGGLLENICKEDSSLGVVMPLLDGRVRDVRSEDSYS